jgi:hypothetical protein
MQVLLGFDPGGADGFGWCIVEDAATLPLRLRVGGVVGNAREAFAAAEQALQKGDKVVAAGVDAPMFWVTAGDRVADRIVRDAARDLGIPSPWGTVQAVNSLRGACLTQGIMIGDLLRRKWRGLPVSESHPKAFLWLARIASPAVHHGNVQLTAVPQLSSPPGLQAMEHQRDAAIAALSAWAMVRHPQDWRDLYLDEAGAYSPLAQPLAYWMLGV